MQISVPALKAFIGIRISNSSQYIRRRLTSRMQQGFVRHLCVCKRYFLGYPYFVEQVNIDKKIEKERSSNFLAYVTGDRRGLKTQIHSDCIDLFVVFRVAKFTS
jgi:hypothetical protein